MSSPPTDNSKPSGRRLGRGLLGLNALLLVLLGIVTFMPNALAQFSPRGDTLVLSGRTGIGNEQVLWMFDPTHMELVVVGWDRTGDALVPLDRRNVAVDVETLRSSR
jgi:hypothetical protein